MKALRSARCSCKRLQLQAVQHTFASGSHGKASIVQTVWFTANLIALKFQPPLQPESMQSTNSYAMP